MLESIIAYYTKGNNSAFAEMIGLSPQGLNSWKKRNSFDAELICQKCPGISARWLLTGEGEMIEQSAPKAPAANNDTPPQDYIKDVVALINRKDSEIHAKEEELQRFRHQVSDLRSQAAALQAQATEATTQAAEAKAQATELQVQATEARAQAAELQARLAISESEQNHLRLLLQRTASDVPTVHTADVG